MKFNFLQNILFFSLAFFASQNCFAKILPSSEILDLGFTPVSTVSPLNFEKYSFNTAAETNKSVPAFCAQLSDYFKKYGWENDPCGNIKWQAKYRTTKDHPLIFAEFGSGEMVTMILGGVHGDELTIPITFRLARYLQDHKDAFDTKEFKVVIAPMVNPDGFMLPNPTRTNANGVDLNRNLFTMDWYALAKNRWQTLKGRDLKVFPGYFPNSEIESLFQIYLIETYTPDKILSLHAPLGFLDYDGPGSQKMQRKLTPTEKRAKQLVLSISEKSQNYKVVDYTYYPGSLGNYAGNERQIPTITLELNTAHAGKMNDYYQQFFPGLIQTIIYKVDAIDRASFISMFFYRYKAQYQQKMN